METFQVFFVSNIAALALASSLTSSEALFPSSHTANNILPETFRFSLRTFFLYSISLIETYCFLPPVTSTKRYAECDYQRQADPGHQRRGAHRACTHPRPQNAAAVRHGVLLAGDELDGQCGGWGAGFSCPRALYQAGYAYKERLFRILSGKFRQKAEEKARAGARAGVKNQGIPFDLGISVSERRKIRISYGKGKYNTA